MNQFAELNSPEAAAKPNVSRAGQHSANSGERLIAELEVLRRRVLELESALDGSDKSGVCKDMEEDLRQAHDEVEERVQERTANLTKLNDKLLLEIGERRRAEKALRESEGRLELALNGADLGLWDWQVQAGRVAINRRSAEIMGCQIEEIDQSFDFWLSLLHSKDKARALEAVYAHLAGRTDYYEDEYRVKTKSGKWKWILSRGKVVERDQEGRPLRMAGTYLDITSRKRTEQKLRRSEERYRTIADFTYDWEYWEDTHGKLLYVSPACERVTGYSVQEFLDDPGLMERIIHPEDRERVMTHVHETMGTGEKAAHSWDFRIVHRNGEIRWINHACRPVKGNRGRPLGQRGCNRDITDRRIAEKALLDSEARYRAVFNNAAIGIDLVDAQGRFQEANPALLRMVGYTAEELYEFGITDITHPDDVVVSRKKLDALNSGAVDSYRLEKRYVRKDGEIFWADVCVSAIRSPAGEHEATIGVITDISNRKRAEEAQKRLATAVEQAAEAIVITDTQGAIQYVNPALERMSGYGREEVIGKTPGIFKSGHHDDEFYKELWNTINSGKVWAGRFVNKRKDGSLFHTQATISPVRDTNGKITNFVAVKRDITEHLQLSNQLIQAQRMEAVGTLAGGLAHDFNNLLTVIGGFSELLLASKKKEDPEYEDLHKIFRSAVKGAELVQRLLTFSRKVEPKVIALNLNGQILEVEKLLERTIPKMIDIKTDLSGDLAEIKADPTQIEQVLMNLAVNARDAMPNGGKLVLKTRNVTLDREHCKVHIGASPGKHVLLKFSDTGHGMDKETLEHIFEPFFTTKEVGQGTGLGLAMVYGIVRQHGGHVTCSSEVGRGTTFNVYFPAIETKSRPEQRKSEESAAGGTETILLVDDDEFLRDLGERILRGAGYSVVSAANELEGLDLLRKEKTRISLVVLDLYMPEMDDAEFLKELLKIDPRVKVLAAGGYSVDLSLEEPVEFGERGFVSKTFQVKELLGQVRKVLDESYSSSRK